MLLRDRFRPLFDADDLGSEPVDQDFATSCPDISKADNSDSLIANHLHKPRLPLMSLLLVHELPQHFCVKEHAQGDKLSQGFAEEAPGVGQHYVVCVDKILGRQIVIDPGRASMHPFNLLRPNSLIIEHSLRKLPPVVDN